MKKIVFLMLHFGYGGVESAIANQANMLCDDYEVEIVSIYKLKYLSPYKLNKKIKIKYLSNIEPNKKELIESFKTKNIYKILKEGFKSLKILYLKKHLMIDYIKKCNGDIIVSTRVAFNKDLGKYGNKNAIKIAQEHVYHKNNNKYISNLINSIKKIDYLMPVSKELTNYYKNRIFLNQKCVYIKHAIDFETEKYNFKKTNNLLAVGRLSKEKGFEDLIDVINIAKQTIPDIKLNLIGDGPEKENLKKKIKNLNLEKNIIMHGFKQRNEINEITKKCSLYCMTSYEESFGLTVIESMSFGLPCIAFDDAKGVLEIINENTGVIIKKRDKELMARTIIELLTNEKMLKSLSKESYKKSLNYSYDNVKKEWLAFYKSIFENQEGTFYE